MKQALKENNIEGTDTEEIVMDFLAENTAEELTDTVEDVMAAAKETTTIDLTDFFA